MISIKKAEGDEITQEMIHDAAALFSNNYGVWGPLAETKVGTFARQGRRIRISSSRLQAECLPPLPARNCCIQVWKDEALVGHVLATRWIHQDRNICWITQLCVDSKHRNQGLATKLLSRLADNDDQAFGILSSHPFAISAALRAFSGGLDKAEISTMSDYPIRENMASSPVDYVRTARLRGSLFETNVDDGTVSCADTNFYVEHTEPDEALELVRSLKGIDWPFGTLPEGHEFLLFIQRQ